MLPLCRSGRSAASCRCGLELGCGLRLSEPADARLDGLLGYPPTPLRVRGKGGRSRDVALMPPVADTIAAYLPTREQRLARWRDRVGGTVPWRSVARRPVRVAGVAGIDGGAVWRVGLTDSGAARRCAQLIDAAGLARRGVRRHVLRHTFATLALRSGSRNVGELQDALGHANLATIEIYTQAINAELAAAARRRPLARAAGWRPPSRSGWAATVPASSATSSRHPSVVANRSRARRLGLGWRCDPGAGGPAQALGPRAPRRSAPVRAHAQQARR